MKIQCINHSVLQREYLKKYPGTESGEYQQIIKSALEYIDEMEDDLALAFYNTAFCAHLQIHFNEKFFIPVSIDPRHYLKEALKSVIEKPFFFAETRDGHMRHINASWANLQIEEYARKCLNLLEQIK